MNEESISSEVDTTELHGVSYARLRELFVENQRFGLGRGRDLEWFESEVAAWSGNRPVSAALLERTPMPCVRSLFLVPLIGAGTEYFPLDVRLETFNSLPALSYEELTDLAREYLSHRRIDPLPQRIAQGWEVLDNAGAPKANSD